MRMEWEMYHRRSVCMTRHGNWPEPSEGRSIQASVHNKAVMILYLLHNSVKIDSQKNSKCAINNSYNVSIQYII
jgi:hypothetical protein